MKSIPWIPVAAAFGVFGVISIGLSQTGARLEPEAEKQARGYRLSQVREYQVLIQEDEPAGQVTDFIVSEGGCIDYVVATYEDQYYLIPYPAASFRYDDSVIFVDLAPAQFRQIQFFGQNDWPDYYASSYRQKVYSTFGIDDRRGRSTNRRDLNDGGDAQDRRDRREDNRDRRRDRSDDRRDDQGADRDRDGGRDGNDLDRGDRDTNRDREGTGPSEPGRSTKPAAPKADQKPPKADPKAPKADPPKTPKPAAPTPAPSNPAPKKPAPKQS